MNDRPCYRSLHLLYVSTFQFPWLADGVRQDVVKQRFSCEIFDASELIIMIIITIKIRLFKKLTHQVSIFPG